MNVQDSIRDQLNVVVMRKFDQYVRGGPDSSEEGLHGFVNDVVTQRRTKATLMNETHNVLVKAQARVSGESFGDCPYERTLSGSRGTNNQHAAHRGISSCSIACNTGLSRSGTVW
jgi:hypothetical protein